MITTSLATTFKKSTLYMHNTVGEDALMNFSQETSDFHDFCAVSKTKSSSPFLGTLFSLTFLRKGTHNKKSVFFFTFSMEERGGGGGLLARFG